MSSVNEHLMANGSWNLELKPDTPTPVLREFMPESKSFYGHIVVTRTHVDLRQLTDAAALALARYTGMYTEQADEFEFKGLGPNAWMGDGDRGRSVGSMGQTTFASWRTALIPSFLTAGVTGAIAGSYVKTFVRTTYREIIEDVAERFDAEWRVTNQFALDFGPRASLFRMTPQALIVRHESDAGRDLGLRGVLGNLKIRRRATDWAWRIIYFWGPGPTAAIQNGGVADNDVPYRAPFGTEPAWFDVIEEDSQTTTSGDALAASLTLWNKLNPVMQEYRLSSREYDISDDVQVGDNVYVYDPQRGIRDMANQLRYGGSVIYPDIVRCVGHKWPIRPGMGVWFRRHQKVGGVWVPKWTDLTDYVVWGDGDATLEIGEKPRRLTPPR